MAKALDPVSEALDYAGPKSDEIPTVALLDKQSTP